MTIPSLFDMTGKTVVITGSTKGIGLEIAKGFRACGARTVISSNLQDDIDAALESLRREGLDVEGAVCDLRDTESVRTFAERIQAQLGAVDTLVAHGGGFAGDDNIATATRENFEKTLLTGPVNSWELIRGFLPGMAERGGGSVVVTSSMASIEANVSLATYGDAKAALNSIVRNIAAEWGPKNVRANAIAPGIVRTAFSSEYWRNPVFMQRVAERIPLGRIAEPEEIVGAVLLLGSTAGSYISGVTLMIDGGRHVV
jgi:NAD(P)-dependent dehydrogenase (short-subunit alcohol dehydrogenase family)